METATGINPSASKRARVDDTVAQHKSGKSPISIAAGHIADHTESLHAEIQDIVNKVGIDFIKQLQRVDIKNRRITKMSSDDDYVPTSARIKFELKVNNDVSNLDEFKNSKLKPKNKSSLFKNA